VWWRRAVLTSLPFACFLSFSSGVLSLFFFSSGEVGALSSPTLGVRLMITALQVLQVRRCSKQRFQELPIGLQDQVLQVSAPTKQVLRKKGDPVLCKRTHRTHLYEAHRVVWETPATAPATLGVCLGRPLSQCACGSERHTASEKLDGWRQVARLR